MKDKLIILTVVILFGLFLFGFAAPRVNAWAAAEGAKTFECAPGAQVLNLADGGIRITGECHAVSAPVVEDAELQPAQIQEESYPVPEPLTTCEGIWRALALCEE